MEYIAGWVLMNNYLNTLIIWLEYNIYNRLVFRA